jgi:hypothetical protein
MCCLTTSVQQRQPAEENSGPSFTRLRVCASDTAPLASYIQEDLSRQSKLIGRFARGPKIVIHHDMWQTRW